MRVFVLGGTGFISSHVVNCLVKDDHEIMVFHRGLTDHPLPVDVKRVTGDRRNLPDFSDTIASFKPDIVLDMCAYFEREAMITIDALKDIPERYVMISSQDVYRGFGVILGVEQGGLEPVPIYEDAPVRKSYYIHRNEKRKPADDQWYYYEKILVERILTENLDCPVTILRLPAVYGPGDPQHRLYSYVKRMADRRPAVIVQSKQAHWRWTRSYIENAAYAITLAVSNERAAGQVYNVGEEEALSETEWVNVIGKSMSWNGEIVYVPEERLPGHTLNEMNWNQDFIVDSSKIRHDLGYTELVSRTEALRKTVAWEIDHPPDSPDLRQVDYSEEDAILAELA